MDPQTNRTHNPQPITQSNSIQPTTNLRAQGRQFKHITVSESLSGITYLSVFIIIRLSSITSTVTEAYQVLEFLTTQQNHQKS